MYEGYECSDEVSCSRSLVLDDPPSVEYFISTSEDISQVVEYRFRCSTTMMTFHDAQHVAEATVRIKRIDR